MLFGALLVGLGGEVAAADGARPTFCDPTDTAINDGHGSAFAAMYPAKKAPLDGEECRELTGLLAAAEAFASRFPTVDDARVAGWTQIADYIHGQGVHFEAPWFREGSFDPRRPGYLLYDGAEADSRLSGMMFLERGEGPPSGFPGDNDHWHNHPMLCFNQARTFVLGEHISDAECSDRGGVMVDSSDLWMVHVWLPVYEDWEPHDVFNRTHPAL